MFSFIPETTIATDKTASEPGLAHLSDFDKAKLEEFATQIRNLPDVDKIIMMKHYRVLVENWSVDTERAQNLLDIDSVIEKLTETPSASKEEMQKTVEILAMQSADTTNKIAMAIKLIRDLVPNDSPNAAAINERLDKIASHPNNIEENRKLGNEILAMVQKDANMKDAYKISIRNQLQFIMTHAVADGDKPVEEAKTTST